MSTYLKAIVSGIGTIAMLVQAATSDSSISFKEANGIWLAVLGLATTLGVYSLPNKQVK